MDPKAPPPSPIAAARHICEEARHVLSSLRSGPPHVARGELAQGLRDVRLLVKSKFLDDRNKRKKDDNSPSHGSKGETNGTSNANSTIIEQSAASQYEDNANSNTDNTIVNNNVNPEKSTDCESQVDQQRFNISAPSSTGTDLSAALRSTASSTNPIRDAVIGHHEGHPITTSEQSSAMSGGGKEEKDNEQELAPAANVTVESNVHDVDNSNPNATTTTATTNSNTPRIRGESMSTTGSSEVIIDHPHSSPTNADTNNTTSSPEQRQQTSHHHPAPTPRVFLETQLGPIVFPFLAIILDPHAAGPHTLVALRSLHRLLARKAFLIHPPPSLPSVSTSDKQSSLHQSKIVEEDYFVVALEPLIRGVLECRFEQTDAGADEAVEMAIADLLNLMVDLDYNRTLPNSATTNNQNQHSIQSKTFMEAFNTVFVTRNTFVHSPALCYHFEEVLNSMVIAIFSHRLHSANAAMSAMCILEFLVSQLLHTPLNGMTSGGISGGGNIGGGSGSTSSTNIGSSIHSGVEGGGSVSSAELSGLGSAEAQALHDATRILCLRLIQSCLRIGWGGKGADVERGQESPLFHTQKEKIDCDLHNKTSLQIIQEDLCLALLMIGQGIWAYQNPNNNGMASPGMISLEILSEVCSVFSTLWNITTLRKDLMIQFEGIFAGFYQRALCLLRRLPVANDSFTFHANQIFDAEMEIILESLVDILSLHGDDDEFDSDKLKQKGLSSALENLFLSYDCDLNRSDVASGIIVELSRCCGGEVNELGVVIPADQTAGYSQTNSPSANTPTRQLSEASNLESHGFESLVNLRHVPAHLRELCAEALVGSMKSIFTFSDSQLKDDINDHGEEKTDSGDTKNSLRVVKERKRLMYQATKIFNEKSSKGIEFLVSSGLVPKGVTPKDVASFLRNGIVVGLDKRAIGEYLGEKGKPPTANESQPWRRDWFHKETLEAYCSSFHFENQSLLDGLRMFLAAFRLPGEAQQIDRILQAFAESCGRHCLESKKGGLPLFSGDPKRASDGSYLLSFSIIMLNTDLHNTNIRADRKMTVKGFILNNSNYGSDITAPGCELPTEYLEGIYNSIREEPIRTEGEGADGVMTFERWKDVLRVGSTPRSLSQFSPAVLRELIVESVWMPILSAIGGFWGVTETGEPSEFCHNRNAAGIPKSRSGMLNAQGARLGMDLSVAMLTGLKHLPSLDIFKTFFQRICMYSGFLQECKHDPVERTSAFIESVERQSVIIIIVNTAAACGDIIGLDGWKMVWSILLELRDLKLLGGKNKHINRSLIFETDSDLLQSEARREWEMQLVKECHHICGKKDQPKNGTAIQKSSLFGTMSRALFGSESELDLNSFDQIEGEGKNASLIIGPSSHRKEELVLWDETATSDVEDLGDPADDDQLGYESSSMGAFTESVGHQFEKQLIHEDGESVPSGAPITGLETYEDIRIHQISPRARVRKRLSVLCDFPALVSETRFLDADALIILLTALVQVIEETRLVQKLKQADGDTKRDLSNFIISPASEAFAELMVCEIALKNRDRLGLVWKKILKNHYYNRLSKENSQQKEEENVLSDPGIEKCLTGLLRISYHSVSREEVNNEVLQSLELLYPPVARNFTSSERRSFDKHLAEGVWRICCDGVVGLQTIDENSWKALLGLVKHCATKGNTITIGKGTQPGSLSDDDPAFKAFRCIHLILHSPDLKNIVPFEVIHCIRALITSGERQKCPKLCIAGLDLLQILHLRLQSQINEPSLDGKQMGVHDDDFILNWRPIVEGVANASDSIYASVRQHSIAMLTDALVDRHCNSILTGDLCQLLYGVCVPMVGQRISELLDDEHPLNFEQEEMMIELELCICAIFKPFTHHLGRLTSNLNELASIWVSILKIMANLLSKETQSENNVAPNVSFPNFLSTTKELAAEHLRNAVLALMSNGVICGEEKKFKSDNSQDMSLLTWNNLEKIPFCQKHIAEWRKGDINA